MSAPLPEVLIAGACGIAFLVLLACALCKASGEDELEQVEREQRRARWELAKLEVRAGEQDLMSEIELWLLAHDKGIVG